MTLTLREAEIRDAILAALSNTAEKKIVAPYVLRQLRKLCTFPDNTTTTEIETVLKKMKLANQIVLDMTRVAIWEIAMSEATRNA